MFRTNVDMLRGPLLRNIVAFAIPVIIGSWMQLLFHAADVVVIGQFCGSTSVAAMGATSAVSALLINMFLGLSTGVSVTVANVAGSGEDDAIQKSVHTAVMTAVIGGLFVAFVGVPLTNPLLRLMGTPATVVGKSAVYMKIILGGNIFSLLYNFGSAIMRASGDSRRPLYFITVSGALNVMLNLFFVLVLKLDVAGVALATVMSNGIAAFLVLRSLSQRTDAFRLFFSRLRIHTEPIKKILRIGIPSGIQASMFAISNVIIQSSINSFGEAMISGNTANGNINGFMDTAATSFSVASINFVGQNMGAENYRRVRRVIFTCFCTAASVGLVLGVATFAFSRPLLGLYITDSAEAIEYGIMRAKFACIPYVFYATYDVLSASMRGLGKSTLSMCVSLGGIGVARVVWIYTIFARFRTPEVLYLSFPVTWLLTGLLMGICLLLSLRKLPEQDKSLE